MYIEIKNVPVRFVNIDGVSYDYNDLTAALNQLFYTDELSKAVLVDARIAKFLCDIKVAERTATGSYMRGVNLLDFIDEIESLR